MSEFKCEVVRVKIEAHPNADKIEIVRIGDYQSIVLKGQFQEGQLAVYIPEQAIVPERMLRQLKMWDDVNQKGGLGGSAGNRVKAIKLRGVLSQGLIYGGIQTEDGRLRLEKHFTETDKVGAITTRVDYAIAAEGEDVAEFLEIVKFEPKLPSHMKGKIVGVNYDATHNYDFNALKKTPTMFEDGEEVVITEKVHGTLICIGVVPTSQADPKFYEGRVVLSSKGMGAKGFILDHNDESNLYAQAATKHGLLDGMLEVFGPSADYQGKPIFIIGEVFGKTPSGADIQDLTYTDEVLDFRAFDICVGNRGAEKYLDWAYFVKACDRLEVKPVPLLYRGPYSKQVVLEHTDGNTTLTDKAQIREGVVVKSATEERNPHFGRKIAKSVSEAYVLRNGATEYN